MSRKQVFHALQGSNANDFLFASVGTEHNGTDLTIPSVLARLGKDPWRDAGVWAKLPSAVAADLLATDIGHMALGQHSVRRARETASRLVELLVRKPLVGPVPKGLTARRGTGGRKGRWWILVCLVTYVSLMVVALGIGMSFAQPGRTARVPVERAFQPTP